MATGVAKSNYLENKLLEHVLKNTAYTSPTTVYLGLFTVAPGEAGGGTEVTGGSYIRKAITFGAASGGSISNSADVDFGTATADWGNIVAGAIFDAASAGNMLYYGVPVAEKLVSNGDGYKVLATKLTVSED